MKNMESKLEFLKLDIKGWVKDENLPEHHRRFREKIVDVLKEQFNLLKSRGEQYNGAIGLKIDVLTYAQLISPFYPSFMPLIVLKAVRLLNLYAKHGASNPEKYKDTIQDLINYCLFQLMLNKWQQED